MKKLNISFEGVHDSTGYLFSFAKCLSAAMRCGGYADLADDVIAASGFAFRMWVDGKELCPSATSIWDFSRQKPWVESAGLCCEYVERLWHEEALEQERRKKAIAMIRRSVDNGFAPVAWDLSGAEWGLIVGYDKQTDCLFTLKTDGSEAVLPCEKLGRLEIPILSVLCVTGSTNQTPVQLVTNTKKLALNHLRGNEWCENACGLAAYDALCAFSALQHSEEYAWNLEYMLGTYAALKWYAWQFFAKYSEMELAGLYRQVYESWQSAFEARNQGGAAVAACLQRARAAEQLAMMAMND